MLPNVRLEELPLKINLERSIAVQNAVQDTDDIMEDDEKLDVVKLKPKI